MPEPIAKDNIKVIVNIRPGPVTPHQRAVWRKFWQKMIVEEKKHA